MKERKILRLLFFAPKKSHWKGESKKISPRNKDKGQNKRNGKTDPRHHLHTGFFGGQRTVMVHSRWMDNLINQNQFFFSPFIHFFDESQYSFIHWKFWLIVWEISFSTIQRKLKHPFALWPLPSMMLMMMMDEKNYIIMMISAQKQFIESLNLLLCTSILTNERVQKTFSSFVCKKNQWIS